MPPGNPAILANRQLLPGEKNVLIIRGPMRISFVSLLMRDVEAIANFEDFFGFASQRCDRRRKLVLQSSLV